MKWFSNMDGEDQLVAIYGVIAIAMCVGAFLIFG